MGGASFFIMIKKGDTSISLFIMPEKRVCYFYNGFGNNRSAPP